MNKLIGKVLSIKMAKTVIVEIIHEYRHPIYKKAVKRMKHYAVHNELEGIAVGDKVVIAETRPVSRRKHFIVVSRMG